MITLSNGILNLTILEKGAELSSIKDIKNGIDYLWNGDPNVWGRHSPVLFPIVGKLKQNQYTSSGNIYNLPQHGFARDMDFKVLSRDSHKIVLSLLYNEETLKKYPYRFELQIEYVLQERKVSTTYRVISHDPGEISFSIGAHPGFTCPLYDGDKMEDYFLEFEKPETLPIHLLKEGLFSGETQALLNNQKQIALSYDLFKNDALVFHHYTSDYIMLKHKTRGEILKFYFKGFPYLGIWSKPGPFVCIEPWYGLADYKDHDGILENKKGIQKAVKNKPFECTWAVEIK